MKGKRTPPEVQARALAMLDAGESVESVAQALGLPRRTVASWKGAFGTAATHARLDDQAQALRQAEKSKMRENFTRIVMLATGKLVSTLESDEKVGVTAASMVAGIAFDKIRLLDGEPTNISSSVDLSSFLKDAGYEELRRKVVPLHPVPRDRQAG